MRPMDGSTVTNVRTSHSDLPGRSQAPRKPQLTTSPPLQEASRPPEAAAVDAVAEVQRLESAIAAQEPTRLAFEGSTESRAGQIQGAASGGQGGVMHVVHRTCPASRHTCRRGDQEGSGTTRGARGGGRGGPTEVVVTAGRGSASTHSQEVLQKQIQELVRERRPLASGVQHTSAQGWPRRMVRRQHPRFDRGASHACRSTRFGGLDEQSELQDAQRFGVRRCVIDCEGWHVVEPRSSVVGISESRRADGREVKVVIDEFHDRRSRCETPVCGSEFLPLRFLPESGIRREGTPG